MNIWLVLAIICGVITLACTIICTYIYIDEARKKPEESNWPYFIECHGDRHLTQEWGGVPVPVTRTKLKI